MAQFTIFKKNTAYNNSFFRFLDFPADICKHRYYIPEHIPR